jgi:hypothetical protein
MTNRTPVDNPDGLRRKGPKTAAGLRHECPIEQNRHANPSFFKL